MKLNFGQHAEPCPQVLFASLFAQLIAYTFGTFEHFPTITPYLFTFSHPGEKINCAENSCHVIVALGNPDICYGNPDIRYENSDTQTISVSFSGGGLLIHTRA